MFLGSPGSDYGEPALPGLYHESMACLRGLMHTHMQMHGCTRCARARVSARTSAHAHTLGFACMGARVCAHVCMQGGIFGSSGGKMSGCLNSGHSCDIYRAMGQKLGTTMTSCNDNLPSVTAAPSEATTKEPTDAPTPAPTRATCHEYCQVSDEVCTQLSGGNWKGKQVWPNIVKDRLV